MERGKRILRSRQDSNLRGQSPMDFESIALTTRPQLLDVCWCSYHKFEPHVRRYQSYRKSLDDDEEPKPRPQSNVGRGTVTSFGRTSRRIGGGTTGSRQVRPNYINNPLVRLDPDGVITLFRVFTTSSECIAGPAAISRGDRPAGGDEVQLGAAGQVPVLRHRQPQESIREPVRISH